jgi:predicted transcriptional regulator
VSAYLSKRVEAAIQDAETKNEALWKIYVFISDGLFYTGTLARLLPNLECANQAGAHRKCLLFAAWAAAQAVKFAYAEAMQKREAVRTTSRGYWLTEGATAQEWKDLVKRFSKRLESEYRGDGNVANWLSNISAVQVDQYLHEDSPDSRLQKCRDIRSRFHEPGDRVDIGSLVAKLVPEEEKERAKLAIIEQLIRAGIPRGNTISEPELADIVVRLGRAELKQLEQLVDPKAARGTRRDDILREIWKASAL